MAMPVDMVSFGDFDAAGGYKKIMPDSVVYTDGLSSHDVLDVSGFYRHRIHHGKHFAYGRNHIKGIGNFWKQVKRTLCKYNRIERKPFPLLLKKRKFRFNFGIPGDQLKTLKKWCGI